MEEEAEVAQDVEREGDAAAGLKGARASAMPVAARTAVGLAVAAGVGLCLWLDSFWQRGYLFAVCGLAVTLLATDEFTLIVNTPRKRLSRTLMGLAAGTLFLLQWAGWAFRGVFPDSWKVAAVFLCVYACAVLCGRVLRNQTDSVQEAFALNVAGLVYVPVLLGFLTGLRMHWGTGAVVLAIVVCKGGSSAAYFGGRYAGRRKLAPQLSPAKTVEGAVAAVAFGGVVAMLLSLASSWRFLGPAESLLFGVFVSVAAIIGDLAESSMKRQSAVKDSGRSFNAMGGMLDMVDDLLFAAPVSFFFFWLFAG